jgi:hypothetical protein
MRWLICAIPTTTRTYRVMSRSAPNNNAINRASIMRNLGLQSAILHTCCAPFSYSPTRLPPSHYRILNNILGKTPHTPAQQTAPSCVAISVRRSVELHLHCAQCLRPASWEVTLPVGDGWREAGGSPDHIQRRSRH